MARTRRAATGRSQGIREALPDYGFASLLCFSRAIQKPLYQLKQSVGGKGLGEERGMDALSDSAEPLVGKSRSQDDLRFRIVLPQIFGKLAAQHQRHALVENEEIIGLVQRHLVTPKAVRRPLRLNSLSLKGLGQKLAEGRIVIDD